MIIKNVPFFANPDETHCFQACLKMILKYYFPEKDYSWEELDKITQKIPKKATWSEAGYLYLAENNFDVVYIRQIDIKRFLQQGLKYLQEEYGKEVREYIKKYGDIKQGVEIFKTFANHPQIKCENRIPKKGDVKYYLSKSYLIICLVNWKMLYHKKGYGGHFVLVFGFDGKKIYFHDPGLPGIKNWVVNVGEFLKALYSPSPKNAELTAIKLKRR